MPFGHINNPFPPFITNGLPTKSNSKPPSVGLITLGTTPGITYTPAPPNQMEEGAEQSTDRLLHPGDYVQNVVQNDKAFREAFARAVGDPFASNKQFIKDSTRLQDDLENADLTLEQEPFTYTGSDLRVFLDMPGANGRQLLELTTITVSVHREKSPVRAVGYINPKAFARGRRTIAGTMVLTQFYADVMYRFLGMKWNRDLSKDAPYKKPDQLPPFNLTFLFADEHGHGSYRRLLGVDAVTDGTVYSTNDMMTEQTLSFMASDFTPLLPLDMSAITMGDLLGKADKSERTPGDARRDELTEVITSTIKF